MIMPQKPLMQRIYDMLQIMTNEACSPAYIRMKSTPSVTQVDEAVKAESGVSRCKATTMFCSTRNPTWAGQLMERIRNLAEQVWIVDEGKLTILTAEQVDQRTQQTEFVEIIARNWLIPKL